MVEAGDVVETGKVVETANTHGHCKWRKGVLFCKKMKDFLQRTKGAKDLNLDLQFADKFMFFISAWHNIKHKASTVLTYQKKQRKG